MKSQKGITLTSLVIYIAISTVVISIMAVVSSFFFGNVDKVKEQDKYASEFNKFNMFFVNDIKNNKTAEVETNKIVFEDGTVYEYRKSEGAIFRNSTRITSNVTELEFNLSTYESTEKTTKNIITVSISIGENFYQSIEYVLKYW